MPKPDAIFPDGNWVEVDEPMDETISPETEAFLLGLLAERGLRPATPEEVAQYQKEHGITPAKKQYI